MTYRLLITAYQTAGAGTGTSVSTQVVPYESAMQAHDALDEIRKHIANRSVNSTLRFTVLPLDPGIETPQT